MGLVLCSQRSPKTVELLELGKAAIYVAEYLTELPPKHLLEQKLQEAIDIARKRFEADDILIK